MNRRRFLTTSGLTGLAGLAGCLQPSDTADTGETPEGSSTENPGPGPTDGTETDTDSMDLSGEPTAPVEAIYSTAIEAQQIRNEVFHSAVLTEEDTFELQTREYTVVERNPEDAMFADRVSLDDEVVKSIVDNGETAFVNAKISFVDGTQERTIEEQSAVATEDGDWMVVEQNIGDSSRGSTPPPNVVFAYDYSEDENVVAVVHDGGDSVPANELFVRGSNVEDGSTGPVHELDGNDYAPGDQLEAGDEIRVAVTGPDYELRIVWESADTDDSATIGANRGPEA